MQKCESDFCNFISIFSKNKKVTKSHFRVLAYVYDVFWCSEGPESQSCVLSALERSGAPKSPKPHFFIRFISVIDVFACSGSPKSTFGALGLFGAVRIAMGVSAVGGRMMEN